MRLTARCIFGTLLAVSSLSWVTAASDEGDVLKDKGTKPCTATVTLEGPCKHGDETVCPYVFSMPPLTINLPMRLRELEQIVEDLQKLKDNVDQLRKMCADCTVSQTERECGSQTEKEHEKLHEDIDTREDGMPLMNETNIEILKENERDSKHECGINGVKNENTVKSDDDTTSEKRDRLKERERKIWEPKRETNKTVIKENEKEETLREVPERDGKTHRKVEGVKGKGKVVQPQVPAAGRNEGRVEREEVIDKNHEETETDRNKVEHSKGSQEDTSEKKHPNTENTEKTEESNHHVRQDETTETEKKTQTENNRTGDRIKMSVDDEDHTNDGRGQHREERKKEMGKEKGVKTEQSKKKPKHTENIRLTEKEKTIKEGEDREREKKTKTGGEKSVQGEQSSTDGDLKTTKTIEKTDLTPDSTTDLTSSPEFTNLENDVAFTSSPSLSSPISHFNTDVDQEVKKTPDGLNSKSTNFMDAGSSEYPNFDSDSGFRITIKIATPTPTITPLKDTGQKTTGVTVGLNTTRGKDKGSATKTTSITATPRQTYTTTLSAVTHQRQWTSKKNISSITKTGVKHTQSQGPEHSEKHKPGIKPEADQTLKHPKNDRKLVQAPLPDKKINNDQRQKTPHQKPTTDQKSTAVKSPKPVQIPKHNQRPELHNLPIDEDQNNEQILKNDQVQPSGQNELPAQKPKFHDKALPPVQTPTSQKKPFVLNTTNYKDPATEQQPISDEMTTHSPGAEKITIHPPKITKPDQRKKPDKNLKSEDNAKSDERSYEYLAPVGNTESEMSPMSTVTPNPNENILNELKGNYQNPSLEPNMSVQVSTPGPKPIPDQTDVKLKPKPKSYVPKMNQKPKPGQNITKLNQKTKPGQNITKINQNLKPGQNITKINQKPKPGQNITKINQKPKPGQNITKINQKPKPGQNITKINQKPKPGQNITKINQKPKPGQNITKINQKPKPGQNITKINQKPKPGQNITKINQKPKPGQNITKINQKPKPGQAPKDKLKTSKIDQIPKAESNTTPRQWPFPGLRPTKTPSATPAQNLKPADQSESTTKTKTDLDPTFISGVASESTHHTETGIQPTSGPVKQSSGVTISPRGTEFSPSDRKPRPLGPKTSITLDPDLFPHPNTLPEGFTMTPTGRIKSDQRTQPTTQLPSILWTIRPRTVISESYKSLMSSTTPGSISLSSNTDYKLQSKIFDDIDEIESSQTTSPDKITISVPYSSVQTTSTVSSDFRSNQYFIPIEKTESETSSVTPNPNENHVSELKEKDQSPSAESNISVQDSTSGQKPIPDQTDTKLKLKPNQKIPKINQKPNPGQNITKSIQKPKPGQNITKSIQKPKPGLNITKSIQKPKPGLNITKSVQKPKPGLNITKSIQKPKPVLNITKSVQKPKPGLNITKSIQKPKPGQNITKINQKPKPGQDITKSIQKPTAGQVPKINQKHPKLDRDQKTKEKTKPKEEPKETSETSDHYQIPEEESNATPKQWPSPGLGPLTRPVFSPGATPAPKLKPADQSESTTKTKIDPDPTFINGVASENTRHTETGIQPTSGPIKQNTEVTHSQRGTEFSPSDRKHSPLGPKTSVTLGRDPFPLNTLPEGFTMSPTTGRIKSDLRTQTTTQSLLGTTGSNTIFGGTFKSLMFSTALRSTSLASSTDSKLQSKIFEKVDEIESSWVTTPDKTTSVPFPRVQTTSTVSSDFRSTTTPTSAFKSKHTFTPTGMTESEKFTSSVTPNPNEKHVSEFKENDHHLSAESNVSVQDSTSGQKPKPDQTDTKPKLKPNQQIPKIIQKPKPGHNTTKIIQKPKPGQNMTKVIQKPKPGQNITKIIQKPKPGQNITKIIQKPKPGQNITKIIQKLKPGQNITKIIQKLKPGQNITKIIQKLKPGQNITKIIQKPKPGQNITKINQKDKPGQVPKINQKHPKFDTDEKTKAKPKPEEAPRDTFETSDHDQIPEVESNATPKQWPSLGLRPSTRPVFSPDATPAPKLKPADQSELTIEIATDLNTNIISGVASESTHHTEIGIQPTSGPIKQNTEVTHSQRGTEFSPSDRKPSPLGPKTPNTLDLDLFPHLNTLPERFTIAPTGRTKSDQRTQWPPPSLKPSTRPVFSPGATPASKLKPTLQSESAPKTKTDLDPSSESTHHTETGIQPTSGPIKQSTEVSHSQRGTEFSPSDRKPSPMGPKISNTLDTDLFPNPNTLPEGFTMSPTERTKSDQRTQTTTQPPSRPRTVIGGTLKSLIFSTTLRSTSLAPSTDSKSQPVLDNDKETASSQTTTPDKTTTSVPYSTVQTTFTFSPHLRQTTTPISASESSQFFIPIEKTEIKISSVTPNANQNAVNELQENYEKPSFEPPVPVQNSTSGQKLGPDQTDTKLKLQPNHQIPKINQNPKPGKDVTKAIQKPKPGQDVTKINQKAEPGPNATSIIQKPKPGKNVTKTIQEPKPGQDVTPSIQKPKPGHNVTKINQKPKPGQNVTKINQKPKPGQDVTPSIQKPKPGQNVPKINQKPKPGQDVTPSIQKPKPGQDVTKINQKPKPGQDVTPSIQKPKPGQDVTKINQKPKPGDNVTKINQKPKPGPDATLIIQKPKPGQNVTKINQKPKPGQNVTKINQKPKPGPDATLIIQKPKPGKNVTKINQKPKPGQDVTPTIQKPKPGQNVTKINQKPKPGQVPKINEKPPKIEADQTTNLRPEPEQAPKNNFETSDLDQIPVGESNKTPKQWPPPGLRPSTRPVFSPGATPASKFKPTSQSESAPKTKTDLDPSSESTHHTETGIQPTSGPIKQSTEVSHSQRGTEFSPSDRKPSPMGPKISNTLDTDLFPHPNTLPEGFTMSPIERTKSDQRTQTTTQPPSRPRTVIGGTLKSLIFSTTPRSTSLASSTDSKSQPVLDNNKETASSQTTTPDKTTTSVPSSRFQTTATLSSDVRSTTTTSGPEAPAELSTPTARELRVKINQVAAFLNNSMNPKLGSPDTTSKDHPEVDGRGSTFSTITPKVVRDCSDHLLRGKTDSGVYLVTPDLHSRSFSVFCDMELNGGGWTVLQLRKDGSVNFNRLWDEYKEGFGDIDGGEFWLGNNLIHLLTRERDMGLRVELEDFDGVMEFAEYEHFKVASERMRFRLMVSGYSGTAGDALHFSKRYDHNNRAFTTPDRDHDRYPSGNCGAYYSSGWWFDACMAANLNGKYYTGRYKGVRDGIFWGTWHNISTEYYPTNERQSFKSVRMMIRPKGFMP